MFDMPGDGVRYVRGARGVDTGLVNGEVAYAAGADTDARSGGSASRADLWAGAQWAPFSHKGRRRLAGGSGM